jgi:two-component system response regulator HydG
MPIVIADGLEIGELLGHARGAFTGAVTDCEGSFEAAHRGTLFIDEIATASPKLQRALLQLLEEKTVRRLGERRERRVDIRLVFATNTDIEAAVLAGEFRRDLYHRLGSLVVFMPALRDHRQDIPELVDYSLQRKANEIDEAVDGPTPSELDLLMEYHWPGNVRELEHVLDHYVVFGRLPERIYTSYMPSSWRERLGEVLQKHRGNKSAAARELRISRNTLHKELKRRGAHL